MKKTIAVIIVSTIAQAVLLAQTPTPKPSEAPAALPTPPAATAQASLKLPPSTQAAFVAGQLIQQLNTMLNQALQVIDNGIPAQNGGDAIAAKDLQAALGPANVMRLRSAVALLAEAPTPAPSASPSPEAKK